MRNVRFCGFRGSRIWGFRAFVFKQSLTSALESLSSSLAPCHRHYNCCPITSTSTRNSHNNNCLYPKSRKFQASERPHRLGVRRLQNNPSAPVNVVAVGLLFGAEVVHQKVITLLLGRWLVPNLGALHTTVS